MADESSKCNQKIFEGLTLPGKEFILPNISSPCLLEEFVVYPGIPEHIEQESYPTAILDDSCVSEVSNKPSIPLVQAVEDFFYGRTDTPLSNSSVKPILDAPLKTHEDHDLQASGLENAKSGGLPHFQEEQNHAFLRPRSFHSQAQSNVIRTIDVSLISSNNPRTCLVQEERPIPAPNRNSVIPASSLELDEGYACSFCGVFFSNIDDLQGHQIGCVRASREKDPESEGNLNRKC